MNLVLKRQPSTATSTQGELFIDGSHECYTLEDVVRDVKIQGETAIPAGTYGVVITHSPHFNRELPLLLDVPNYSGVRIHSGNTARDTEGCILVGLDITAASNPDELSESRKAFEPLFEKIKAACDAGEPVTLRIENA